MPYCPEGGDATSDAGDRVYYDVTTRPEKWVADYARLSFADIGELCYYDYRILLRDAVIFTLAQSEKGREYLEKCWLLEQTETDKSALRKKTGKE